MNYLHELVFLGVVGGELWTFRWPLCLDCFVAAVGTRAVDLYLHLLFGLRLVSPLSQDYGPT